MTVYITKKQSWLRLLVSLVPAAAFAALLCNFFAGPRLGPHYDFLAKRRPAPPVSTEILLIDTGGHPASPAASGETANILEPSAAASVLMSAAELGASTLILEAPVLGLSAGGSPGAAEIRYRFNEEFEILSENIRSLFDAIRTGSVAPEDAASYVAELVNLSEKGKERLVSFFLRHDEEGLKLLFQAEKIFGNVRRPDDLLVQVIRPGDLGISAGHSTGGTETAARANGEYFRAKPDSDGVIRRAAPARKVPDANGGELHIVYGAIRDRYSDSRIEQTDEGFFLVNRIVRKGEESLSQVIPLDRNGALLFEIPRPEADFNRIAIEDFLDYDEAGGSLRKLLGEAETLGAYNFLPGEKNPLYLWDYALSLKDDLTENPDEEKKAAWISARSVFFESLESFLYGPSEMNLVSAYEEMIANEALGEDGEKKVAEFRDGMIRSFIGMRQKYEEITNLRKKLMIMNGAFCILGSFSGPDLTDARVSALLANSLLTGRAIRPGPDLFLFLAAILCVIITALCTRPFGAVRGFLLGLVFVLFFGAVFSFGFIFSGYWLDPLVPAGGAAAFVILSFLFTLALKYRFARLFKNCYGACISRAHLRKLIRSGRPFPSEKITVNAAIVAVRDPRLALRGDGANAPSLAAAFLEFRERAAAKFKRAGAVILVGYGDTLLACFGSPLERAAPGRKKRGPPRGDGVDAKNTPALRAAGLVSELIEKDPGGLWQYSMDAGECCFTWSALSGYSGYGLPVIRSRALARLAARYEARFLVTETALEALPDLPAKRLAVLKSTDGSGSEAFYKIETDD